MSITDSQDWSQYLMRWIWILFGVYGLTAQLAASPATTNLQPVPAALRAVSSPTQLPPPRFDPPRKAPEFVEADIRASRVVSHGDNTLPDKPSAIFDGVDTLNLFIVVESGGRHITLLDGDKLAPLHQFASRNPVQTAPAFTADGRFVFFASRDGWIAKFDLWNLTLVAQVRAGLATHQLVLSGDGKFLAVANDLPQTLVLLDADLNLLKVHNTTDKDRKTSSRVTAVVDAASRKSFVVALQDVPEVWEVSYNPRAEDIPAGMVHDFQYKEGAFISGYLNPRRTFLSAPLDDFFLAPNSHAILGRAKGAPTSDIIHLDVRKKIASLKLPGTPHLAAGVSWQWQGKPVLAIPDLVEGLITVVDVSNWKVIQTLVTPGNKVLLRTHQKTPYLWVHATEGSANSALLVLDKGTLAPVASFPTEPGKPLTSLEFTRDGKTVLASLGQQMSDGGALLVFDAATFKLVKRIPMDRPRGAYSIYNQLHPGGATAQTSR